MIAEYMEMILDITMPLTMGFIVTLLVLSTGIVVANKNSAHYAAIEYGYYAAIRIAIGYVMFIVLIVIGSMI